MVQYKLYSFGPRGMGEPIRMILHYAGVKFEDAHLPRPIPNSDQTEWQKLKPSRNMTSMLVMYGSEMPYGQLPVLEADGKMLAQSNAICRHLARKYGSIVS